MKGIINYITVTSVLFMLCTEIKAQQDSTLTIVIQTEMGDITAILFIESAPVTTSNFIYYVSRFGNDGGEFYRSVRMDNQHSDKVKIEVIQAGFILTGIDTSDIHPIPLERTSVTGIKHTDGTLSMARDDPDSGSTEFFICIGDQPSLDFGGERNPDGQGFAAFGRVTKGMDVIRKIHICKTDGQILNPVVKILRMYLKQE